MLASLQKELMPCLEGGICSGSSFPLRIEQWYNDTLCKALGYQLVKINRDNTGVSKVTSKRPGNNLFTLGYARAANSTGLLRALALHEDALNAASCERPRRDIFKEIKRGDWSIVFLGPEMVTNQKVGELLHSQQSCSQLRYFSVDEAHLVIEWVNFRSAFLNIQRLRNRFSKEVVWLALTATAEPTRECVLRLPVDRKAITYASRYLHHTSSDTEFLDLAWVIPLAATRAHEILITVIFADKFDQLDRIIAYLTRLLPSTIEKRKRNQIIQPVSGIMSIEHNTQAVESVRSSGETQVLVLGINLPQVQQVQQVAILVEKGASYRMLCQKIGRIRNGGLAILYFHRWMSITRTGANRHRPKRRSRTRNPGLCELGDPHEPFDDKDRPCCNIHSPEVDKNHLSEVAARLAKARAVKKASVISIRSDCTYKPPDELVLPPIIQNRIYKWRRLILGIFNDTEHTCHTR
ncbi:hypothetical protein BDV93DRAFT_511335 [Ceratobasidium sp. AG-I]|nr:hypothetical protein BDV93DRAFT_511335 [Ceratobasidium sp. AG-I]